MLFPGIDYVNARVADLVKFNEPQTCSLDRNIAPRMPWHDMSVVLWGTAAGE